MRNALICMVMPLFLGGCSLYNLEELRRTTPQGSPYQHALAEYYRDFAEDEERRYDWWDSAYFASKGLRAAFGHDVEPEELAGWQVSAAEREALEAARKMLLAALTPEAKVQLPNVAAEALVSFDCWVEQAEEDAESADAAYCRDHMEKALEQLQQAAPATLAEKPDGAAADAAYTSKISYLLLFPKGSAVLDKDAQVALQRVLADVQGRTDYRIALHGGYDPEQPGLYNPELSDARADAVIQALSQRGIDAAGISLYGFGSEHDVATAMTGEQSKPHLIEIIFND